MRQVAPQLAVEVVAAADQVGIGGFGTMSRMTWFAAGPPDPWGSEWLVLEPQDKRPHYEVGFRVKEPRVLEFPGPELYSSGPNLRDEGGRGDDLIVGDLERPAVRCWVWVDRLQAWIGGFLLWVTCVPWRSRRASGPWEAVYVATLASFPAALIWRAVLWGREHEPNWKLPFVDDTMLVSSHTAVGVTSLGLLLLGAVAFRVWVGGRESKASERTLTDPLAPPPERPPADR